MDAIEIAKVAVAAAKETRLPVDENVLLKIVMGLHAKHDFDIDEVQSLAESEAMAAGMLYRHADGEYHLAMLQGENHFILGCESSADDAQAAGEKVAREQGFNPEDVYTIGPVKLARRDYHAPDGADLVYVGDIYIGDDTDHCYGVAYR